MDNLAGTEFEGLVSSEPTPQQTTTQSAPSIGADLIPIDKLAPLIHEGEQRKPEDTPSATETTPKTDLSGTEFEGLDSTPKIESDIGYTTKSSTNKPYFYLDNYSDANGNLDKSNPEIQGMAKVEGWDKVEAKFNDEKATKALEENSSELLAKTMSQMEHLSTIFTENKDARNVVIDKLKQQDPKFNAYQDPNTKEWFFTSSHNKDPRPFDTKLADTLLANKNAIGLGILAGVTLPFVLPEITLGGMAGSAASTMGLTGTSAAIGTAANVASTAGGLIDQQLASSDTGKEVTTEDRLAKAGATTATGLLGSALGTMGGQAVAKLTKYFKQAFNKLPAEEATSTVVNKGKGVVNNLQVKLLNKDLDNIVSGMSDTQKNELLQHLKVIRDQEDLTIPLAGLDGNSITSMLTKIASRNPLAANAFKEDLAKAFPKFKDRFDELLTPKGNFAELPYSEKLTQVTQALKEHRENIKAPIQKEYSDLMDEAKGISVPVKDLQAQQDLYRSRVGDIIKHLEGSPELAGAKSRLSATLAKLDKNSVDTTKLADQVNIMKKGLESHSDEELKSLAGLDKASLTQLLDNIPTNPDEAFKYLSNLGNNAKSLVSQAPIKQSPITQGLGIKPAEIGDSISTNQIEALNNLGKSIADNSASTLNVGDLLDIARSMRPPITMHPQSRKVIEDDINQLKELAGNLASPDFKSRLKMADTKYAVYKSELGSEGTNKGIQMDINTILAKHNTDLKKGIVTNMSEDIMNLFGTNNNPVNNATKLAQTLAKEPNGRDTLDKIAHTYVQGFIEDNTKELNPTDSIAHFSKVFSNGTNASPTGLNLKVLEQLLPPIKYNRVLTLIKAGNAIERAEKANKTTLGMSGVDSKIWMKAINSIIQYIPIAATKKEFPNDVVINTLIQKLEGSSPKQAEEIKVLLDKAGVNYGVIGTKAILKTEATNNPSNPKADRSKSYKLLNKGINNGN